ncbi:hypothetical protein [Azospirillum canadense]|uniref:hypothetical protein n=1 Tax=Azospirillum canadense TaxID=403962 RepID=UPI002226AF79|nr:hypothetical protein [Azospirillum canadense]MCW2240781.1 hypothetical protein [Azospirillum canadense]
MKLFVIRIPIFAAAIIVAQNPMNAAAEHAVQMPALTVKTANVWAARKEPSAKDQHAVHQESVHAAVNVVNHG